MLMSESTPIENRKNTVVKTIKRLYQDCGWKQTSIYRCNVCQKQESLRPRPIPANGEFDYSVAKPLIVQHIKEAHPEYCYQCKNGCGENFCTKMDKKFHETKKNNLCSALA